MKQIPYCVGLERESLRMSSDGTAISCRPHPLSFGDPLTNRLITMDFAESQLEISSPVFASNTHALHWMEMALSFALENLGDDIFWPMSLPPLFDDRVKLAFFGNSETARKKHLIRLGLKHRYSLNTQLISGYHYNFSLPESVLKQQTSQSSSEAYLHIIRNFIRYGWIITYFTGASPFSSKFPFATSIRQSREGYTNEILNGIHLNYNSLELYVEALKTLTHSICPAYLKFAGNQLNPNILQTDKEHYFMIRPKRTVTSEMNELEALEARGIQYLEIRCLDINPLYRVGTSLETLSFLKNFLLFCLFKPSPLMSADECGALKENHFIVAERGLEKGIALTIGTKSKSLDDWIDWILSQMDIQPPEVASKRLKQLVKTDPIDYCQKQAVSFAKELRELGCSMHVREQLEHEAVLSSIKKWIRDSKIPYPIEPIQDMEMSTQVIIREALLQGIDVEILDRQEHFIRLKNHDKVETIKHATMTSKDSYVTVLIKGNKALTKRLLKEHRILVPEGTQFRQKETAFKSRKHLPFENLVIKPNTTNMGISIHFVHKSDALGYEKAIEESFLHSDQVIVEEYIPGQEYRFLIVNFHTIAVTKRVGAHVVGDGHSSVSQLIEEKNRKKLKKGQIIGIVDDQLLNSIPQIDEMVVLRKQSNISLGGDAIDATDDIESKWKLLAEKAATSIGSKICGVDMVISDKGAWIIELNYNPMLSMHTHPDLGKARDVTTPIFKLLDLL